ncbi:hypothetical protein FA95DRAFT_742640 [Auriscalpium vulgare]|uniref:Uncharacterized protein n=1 Tax=Auriscalpium vulgare TaxID=40419 RepID=A0ACB8SAY3_9AGAM|nr:hypothetical protein FA95DRAFT_742640 [Auriscalpium vulgare]
MESSDATIDLGKLEGVAAYVSNTPFACTRITPLSGGNTNFVYRLHLCTPFEGRNTLVLKHAKSYVQSNVDFSIDVERQDYEVEALRRVKAWLPSDAVVTVPAVHAYDATVRAIIMDDAGAEGLPTLKQLFIEHPPTGAIAASIGAALGEFLGRLHAWGRSADGETVINYFAQNTKGKAISAFVTYGRLADTLAGVSALPVLDGPPLGIPEDTLRVIRELAARRTEDIRTSRETFLMGDYWPGNMLVRLGADAEGTVRLERIHIVDWEVAKTGPPGLDVGQLSAEICTAGRFHPESRGATEQMLTAFLRRYFARSLADRIGGEQGGRGSTVEATARVALEPFGAHLVAWTPRVGWGDVQKTREAVLEGVDCLVESSLPGEPGQWTAEGLIGRFLRKG